MKARTSYSIFIIDFEVNSMCIAVYYRTAKELFLNHFPCIL